MTMRPLPALLLSTLALAACAPDRPGPEPRAAARDSAAAPPPAPAHAPARWRSAPAEGVALRGGDTVVVETGPHTVLWPAGQGPLAPPYTVRVRMRKLHGRLAEGYGIVFGGRSLEGPEAGQAYTYFMVRGDGSWLIKRRAGPDAPVVRPWSASPAIRRDVDGEGRPNQLEVRVGEREAEFRVNGTEVARVPAAELDVRGVPGLRVAHGVQLAFSGFEAAPGAGAAEDSP